MDLHAIHDKLSSAQCPEDVFGGPSDGSAVPSVYRQLMAVIHPDKFEDQEDYDLATATFSALTTLKGDAERKVLAGTYGDRSKEAPAEKTPFVPYAVTAGGKKFILTDLIAEGDVCNIYACTAIDSKGREFEYAFKIVHDGSDNDLLINEAKVLKKIHAGNLKYKPDAADRFRLFLPQVLDSFVVREPGSQRKVSILPKFGEHRSLEEIIRVFPDGIDYRDMVWMFKRIMHGLGFPHRHNIVHGGIVPSHVMIHPINHGAKILDWSYAVDLDVETKPKKARSYFDLLDDGFLEHPHVRGINGRYREYYPPEVFDKETPTAATDVYMAAKCAIALVGGDVKTGKAPGLPTALQRFFLKCTEKDPSNRPQDTWDIHEEFDKLLKTAVGPRKYRPFPMPARK